MMKKSWNWSWNLMRRNCSNYLSWSLMRRNYYSKSYCSSWN